MTTYTSLVVFLFFFLSFPPPPRSTLFPYTTLFRSILIVARRDAEGFLEAPLQVERARAHGAGQLLERHALAAADRKSTRLNSSHVEISYAVFCLKKKNMKNTHHTRRTVSCGIVPVR